MYVSLELARSMSFYAAMSIADGGFDSVIAARTKHSPRRPLVLVRTAVDQRATTGL
jgi:hypothetical protein